MKFFFTLLLSCVFFAVRAGNYGGLGFRDNELPAEERTSYEVFDTPQAWIRDSLHMEFDISLSPRNIIGNILTCKSENKNLFKVTMTNYAGRGLRLDLTLNFASCKISLPMPPEECYIGLWHHVELDISLAEGRARFKIGDRSRKVRFDKVAASKFDSHCRYVFGLCDHYLDVSMFALRNLALQFDNDRSYFFPLNEARGDEVHAVDGTRMGSVKHPVWFFEGHYKWKPLLDFEECEPAAICHDERTSRILIYTSGKRRVYDITKESMTESDHASDVNLVLRGGCNYAYNPAKGTMFLYNNMAPAYVRDYVARYDWRTGRTEILSDSHASHHRHQNTLLHNRDFSQIYQYGGYGNFHYSDRFTRWDADSLKWRDVDFSGDKISPRFYGSAGCYSEGENDYALIYGGYGNETGCQEDGGQYLYDLYRVDIGGRKVTKLCDFGLEGFDQTACRNLIVSPSESKFVTLCYAQHCPDAQLRLYEFDYKNRKVRTVSDSIPLLCTEIQTKVHLFRDDKVNRLICVVQEFANKNEVGRIRIYGLLYPPVTDEGLSALMPSEETPMRCKLLSGALLLLLLSAVGGGVWWWLRRKKQVRLSAAATEGVTDAPGDETSEEKSHHANAVLLLGDFMAFDRNGRDISYMFSPKIRQLFLLVFLHSVLRDRQGVTSNEIASVLWPTKDFAQTKNIRGVSICNLRNVLAEMDGISLVSESGKWRILFDESLFHCDVISVTTFSPSDEAGDEGLDYECLRPLIKSLRRGVLLANESYEWLDGFKSEFEDMVLSRFYPLMQRAFDIGNFKTAYKLSCALLLFDALNEEIMRIEVNALVGLGDAMKAHLKFRQFAISYYQSYEKHLDYEDFVQNVRK